MTDASGMYVLPLVLRCHHYFDTYEMLALLAIWGAIMFFLGKRIK